MRTVTQLKLVLLGYILYFVGCATLTGLIAYAVGHFIRKYW